ncbi:MAG TPA: glycosyltransferase family 4 protein [Thermoanaerobaculaceae bacterium]|nr:glycosyltransferase family 4 protein [Thermoanaerobaculaceae bacterium]
MARHLLVGPSWPLRGGIARTTTRLAATLESRGELAGFLTAARQYPQWLYPGVSDIDPEACRRLDFARPCFGALEPWTWPGLLREARAAAGDALLLPYWTWAWAPLEAWLARRLHVPVVAIVHNPADHDASYLSRLAARRVLSRASGFFCHASAVGERIGLEFPNRPSAVHALPPDPPPAADRAAARAHLGVPEHHLALLCFGLIRPYKGVEVLLDSLAGLPRELPVTLLLAGEPWHEAGERLRARLAAPDLAGRVVARLEWLPESEAPEWFAAADVAVLPYLSATGSAVAAQALGAGLPVVGSRVGGIAEVVDDGVSGLLVPPGEVPALTSALRQVFEPGLVARLAQGSRRAATRWSWSSYADTLQELVRAVLEARPRTV